MQTPLSLASQLAPLLAGTSWSIGGTTMLHLRGVTNELPRDLDSFTTHADFAPVCARIESVLGPGVRPPHGQYASDHFITFRASHGVEMDVIAGAAVVKNGMRQTWHFNPSRVQIIDGLPLMLLDDWLALYALFDRPRRIAQIQAFLART
jgi:hypothetical protein